MDNARRAILSYHNLKGSERQKVFAWMVDEVESLRGRLAKLYEALVNARRNERTALEMARASRNRPGAASNAIAAVHDQVEHTVEATRCVESYQARSLSEADVLLGPCTLQVSPGDVGAGWSTWRAALVHHATCEVVLVEGLGLSDLAVLPGAGRRTIEAVVVEYLRPTADRLDLAPIRDTLPGSKVVEMGWERGL